MAWRRSQGMTACVGTSPWLRRLSLSISSCAGLRLKALFSLKRNFARRWNLPGPPAFDFDHGEEVSVMDKEHIKGAADKAKGAIKETAGKVMGDKEMQAEGKMDKAKGEARKIAGDLKDAARDATKR